MKSRVLIGVLALGITAVVAYILISDLSDHTLPEQLSLDQFEPEATNQPGYFRKADEEGWFVRDADGVEGKLTLEYREQIFFRTAVEYEIVKIEWEDNTYSYWSHESTFGLEVAVASTYPDHDSINMNDYQWHQVPLSEALSKLPRLDADGKLVKAGSLDSVDRWLNRPQ